MRYFVYVLTNAGHSILYVGVTSDLPRRLFEHKEGLFEGFTKKYGLAKLIYAEAFDDINQAIHREKCIKRWKREWKENLINENNPDWLEIMPT